MGLRWGLIALAAAVVAMALTLRPMLTALGWFLVVDDGLRHVDAVVVLGGDGNRDRLRTAAGVMRRGFARGVIVVRTTPSDFFDEAAAVQALLQRQGISPDWVFLTDPSQSTAGDARVAAELMKRQGWRHALIVTNPLHTRRAALVFGQVWRPLDLSYALYPTRPVRFDPRRWWLDESSREAVVLEYVKLGVFVVSVILPP